MSVSVSKKPFLANFVLENELGMGIQFSEIYFGLELWFHFIKLWRMDRKWIKGNQEQ